MQNLNNFILISNSSVPENNLICIDNDLLSGYSPVVHKSHYCFYHGIFHNSYELSQSIGSVIQPFEEVLIELYLKDQTMFPSLLKGNFSLVIGNKEQLYLLRDGNGYENIYFSVSGTDSGSILVSNSIKEIARYFKLEVDTDILPEYFLKTDVNSGDTFFRGIKTLAFFEFAKVDLKTRQVQRGCFDDFFMVNKTVRPAHIKKLIDKFDNLFQDIINEKYIQLKQKYKIINALSGGTDSTFVQYYLKENGSDTAYTANFKKAGLDHEYASDVADFMYLKQKTIQCDTSDLLLVMPEGIYLSEKPFLFAGESMLLCMYRQIGNDFGIDVACFDGTGAEGILGASRILYELHLIRKFRFLTGLILPLIKFGSKKYYNRYKEFHKFVNGTTIPENFILRYFTDEKIRETVRAAFNLSNLDKTDKFEISMMKRYNASLFEAVYRYLAFELEYKRVNNVRVQLAKKYQISIIFPFTETRLFRFLISYDTEIKLRKAKTKYLFRRAMEKKFPKKFIYRKKIRKNVSVYDELLQDEKAKEIIKEIKAKQYPYFNFNYDEVFGSPAYSAIAYKLINFHVWHKLFIDRHEVDGVGLQGLRQKAEG
jgi:asparagine synthetase B (glutamine-hydrolysing)